MLMASNSSRAEGLLAGIQTDSPYTNLTTNNLILVERNNVRRTIFLKQ